MGVLRHWLATSPRYSVDPCDCHYLATEDEAEKFRRDGWRVDGPYVEADAYRGAVEILRELDAVAEKHIGWRTKVEAGYVRDMVQHALDRLGGRYQDGVG